MSLIAGWMIVSCHFCTSKSQIPWSLSFRYLHCTGQFTPKMKANAEPHLLSSLVWIDTGVVVSQHRLESFSWNKTEWQVSWNSFTPLPESTIWPFWPCIKEMGHLSDLSLMTIDVIPQRYVNLCCNVTKFDCTHCSRQWQLTIKMSKIERALLHHCIVWSGY